jgi:hypothetical protein
VYFFVSKKNNHMFFESYSVVLSNNVLLVKIEGPVWYTIYHHLPVVKGVVSNPSINQPTNGKRISRGIDSNDL